METSCSFKRLFSSSRFLFTVATAILLVTTSCKKGDSPPSIFLSCKVDGTDLMANGIEKAYAVKDADKIYIYGDGPSALVTIIVPLGISEGSHSFDFAQNSRGDYSDGVGISNIFSTDFGMGGGTFVINEIDLSHVKGVFQFTAYDFATGTVKKTITDGEFNVEYK